MGITQGLPTKQKKSKIIYCLIKIDRLVYKTLLDASRVAGLKRQKLKLLCGLAHL